MKTSYLLPFLLLLPACKKFLQVQPPPGQGAVSTVFNSDSSATAAILAIYDNMNGGGANSNTFISGHSEITITCGGSADELINYYPNPDIQEIFDNQLTAGNGAIYTIWSDSYQAIYAANAAIAGLANATAVSSSLRADLSGEAKFVRAFCYFYLINLYGEVPLILGTNYQVNSVAARSTVPAVYQQIIADLVDAQTDLSAVYWDARNNPTMDRVRPVKAAAAALLARAYLYTGNYQAAATQATAVIDQPTRFWLTPLDTVFLKNNGETIWALQPPGLLSVSTFDAGYFIFFGTPGYVSLDTALINAFEPGDQRFVHWVGRDTVTGVAGLSEYYYAYKYKETYPQNYDPTEYPVLLRLAEQYLIRAEARANLGDIAGARADLDTIRARAGLPPAKAMTAADLQNAVLHERQVELFAEMGHRWLDLKRSGLANAVLAPLKPAWTPDAQLFPVPAADISLDPNLLPQNPGY